MKNRLLPLLLAMSWGASLLVWGNAMAQTKGSTTAVGQVTLHIGPAVRVSSTGQSTPIERGTLIRAGDRIETAEGGHVHIRFVDGALVSVRPTSRLVVENYDYNPQQVAQSLVRFRLEKGITRAISGAAAEGAKERFRLNTPLVAIGVRGTDFVVGTQTGETAASVNQGAIVMAPFGEGCLQQAVGPCSSPSAKLLSADMGNMLVEFRKNLAQPELRLLDGTKPIELVMAQTSTATATGAGAGDLASNNRQQAVNRPLNRTPGDETAVVASVQSAIRTTGLASSVEPLRPLPVPKPDILVPVVEKPAPPIEPAQLAWGRWSAVAAGRGDFSQLRADASTNRAVTVGDDNFLLYRAESASSTLSQNLGSVNFALQQSYAQFASPSGAVLPASVTHGALAVDFANRNFSTVLGLQSAPTGAVVLQTNGFMRDDGIFFSRSAVQNLAGAVAFDGKSAGYFFDKAAAGGVLSGITLWSR